MSFVQVLASHSHSPLLCPACLPPQVMWAVCVYLEAVSVLPQLRMMQNSKVVERFTAHYVFCLGLSRFFSCAHWILQLLEGNKYLLHALGSGLWPVLVLLSEIVQTFILADFWCVPRQEGGSASWSHAVAGRLLPSLASCAASSSGAWAGCHVLFQIRKMPCWTTPSTCVLA